jgi:hypothetical protein
MKTRIDFLKSSCFFWNLLVLTALVFGLAARPVSAAPATIVIVGGTLTSDATWTQGNTYQVDSYIDVPLGVTLTIEAGVTVENYGGTGGDRYNFDVEGTLIANGTAAQPIHFKPGSTATGWSGINITGPSDGLNIGSSLTYVIVEGGGFGGSGVSADLRLQYAVVDVHHCQFNDSPGDGILGDDATGRGVANIYDSSFTNNLGYAVDFQDGSVNPVLSNLTATGNDASLPNSGNLVYINDATLHGAHIWENMGLPYLILGTMVGPDSVLTIKPGVQVLAYTGSNALDVQGKLVANGTVSQPIHFDPADPTSGWSGIAIRGEDNTQLSNGNLLNHIMITKGGFTGGICDLYVTYGDVTVTNSQLNSSQDSGVCLDHGATLVMTDTQLTSNQQYAMDVFDVGAQFTLENLTATGNLSNTVGIEGGIMTGVHTWPMSGINTYDLHYSYVTIAPTGTLNIEPGVTILFGDTRDITIEGVLNAIGTPSNPILFTGEIPTGLWAGLSFVGTPEQHAVGRFAYATIEYGGYGGSAMVSIDNADVTFSHCVLRNSAHEAIIIQPGSEEIALSPHASVPLPMKVYWSRLYNLGGYAIDNQSSQPVLASYNWWGSASGPTADDNPGGTGSALSGLVLYQPYLTGPNQASIFLALVVR